MGRIWHEFEALRRPRTFSMGPRPPPTTAQRAEAGGGAPDSNDPISAAPTAWEKPRWMRPASPHQPSGPGDLVEHGQRSKAGAHLHGFIERVETMLSTCSDAPPSTYLQHRSSLHGAVKRAELRDPVLVCAEWAHTNVISNRPYLPTAQHWRLVPIGARLH